MPIPSPIPSSSSPSYWISPDDPHTPSSGTTSQSSPIVGDHHKVSDTFQNQHSHASGTISGDASGGSANGNVQQDTFAPSGQHSPDLAQQEPWANQPQHTFPNPQQGSDASTTASSPITSEGSGGTASQSSPIVGSHPDSAAPPTASNAVYGGSGTPIEETSGNAAPQSSASAPVSTGSTSSAGGDSGGFQGSGSSSSFDDSSSTQGYSGDFQGSGSSSSFDGSSSSTEGYPQSSGDASGSAPLSGFNGAGASIGAATAAGAAGGASNQDLQCHAGDPAPTTAQNAGGTPTANGDATMHVKEKVQFSDADSDTLRSALDAAAEHLETQQSKRTGDFYTATTNFTGKYSEDFATIHNQLKTNATNVASMLRYAAKLVDYVKECAHVENRNCDKAREWDDKSWWQGVQDWWNDKDSPDYEKNPDKPAAPAAPATTADTPTTSVIIGNGEGMSSAMPENLKTYTDNATTCESDATGKYNAITNALAAYQGSCKHGQLDISATVSSLNTWIQQSQQVTTWLSGVAQDFRDAGARSGNPVPLSNAYLDQQMQARGQGKPNIQPIEVNYAEVSGEVPSSGFANDPVNVATGNFIEPETDLIFAGTVSESTLSLTRMYNSLAVTHADEVPSGVFGLGWFSTLDTHLSFGDEQASWFMPDGREVLFDREGEGFARAAREPWWLTKVPATDELFTRVRDAQVHAYEQAKVTGGSAVVPEVPFVWMAHNNQHEAYFYAPSGAPVARRQGHLSSLTVFILAEDGTVTDLVHPVAHRGIHVNYEPAEETGGVRPAAAFTYNAIGERAGEPVQNVAYSYTEAAESSASVQVSGLLTGVTTGTGTRTYTHTERGLIHRVINSRGDLEVTNTYDDSGRVIAQISEYGRDISYTYTPSLTTIIADAGTGENENLWVSDSKGRLVSITATDGTRMSMSYDRFSNRISITERDGSRLVRTSDARGHIKRERTPEGADYTYIWDEQDRLLSVSVRDARDVKNLSDPMPVNSYHYEESSLVVNPNPVAVLDGAGEATTWEYSPEGDILKITDPTGVFTAFEYDEHHDIVAMLNPAGEAIRFTRDAAGQVTSVSNPLGATTTLEYNAAGVLTSFTNPLGARWTLTYPQQPVGDGAPYMVRAHQQGGQARDASVGALPEAVTDPAGNTTAFTYTAGGDIATVTNAVGGTTRHEYDTFGNLVKMITAGNRVWEYSWDGLSQLVGLTDPTGAITQFEYDRAGEITQVTDATGVISHRSIERHEGVESVTGTGEGLFSSAFFKVDVLGRVTEISQQDGASTTSASSSHGASGVPTGAGAAGAGVAGTAGTGIPHGVSSSVESIAAAETAGAPSQPTGRQMFTYDAAGNIVEALDANGGLTQYVRDAAGRVTRIISPAGRFIAYTYDTCGRLVTESVGLNEPVRVTDPVTGASSWEEPTRWAVTTLVYDAASQVIERHTPDGLVEKMTYDAAGRLTKVQAGRRVATYAWDACNQLVRVQDSTFGTRRYSYNELGQLVRVTDGLGNRTFFVYDADGLLTSVTDPTGAITEYEYDAAGRILEVAKKPHPDSTVTAPAIRTTYTWDAAGRLLSEDDGVRTRSFEYDARTGDLTRTLIDGSLAAEYGTGTPALPGSTITWMKDHTGDAPVTYRRVFDATGNLVEYTRQVDGTENTSEPGTAEALETFTSTDSYTLTYAYDADGFRTMMLTPYGSSQWVLDGAGHPIRSINTASIADPGVRERESVIGEFSYDVMGHLVRAQIGETISTWDFDQDGLVSSYEHTSEQGDENTAEGVQVIRDHTGRIIGLDSTATGLVMYSYDEAGQLTGARADGYELTWVYEDGLMVAERLYHHGTAEDETTQGRALLGERQFIYNGLNQLLHCTTIERPYTVGEGVSAAWVSTEVSYTYNAAGQRTGQKSVTSDGVIQERSYTWGITGALTTVSDTTTDALGAEVPGLCSRLRIHADATGVATAITGNDQVTVPLLWDPISSAPHLLGAGAIPAAGADGGFSQAGVPGGFDPWSVPGVPNTGVGFGALSAPGLGTISATGAAAPQTQGLPSALGAPGISGASALLTSVGLPEGVSFTGSGTLAVGGLALMGARVFDPSSKKFLSQDPLPPIVGAGWFADSYSFLGHDPIGMIDPWGTQPVSQNEFKKYTREQRMENWKTALTVVATVATVASIFVTGPVGLIALGALAGAAGGAASSMKMKADGSGIDWGAAGKGALKGGVTGALTAGAGKVFTGARVEAMASKLVPSGSVNAVTKFAGSKYAPGILNGGLSGGVQNVTDYVTNSNGNWTVKGALATGTSGMVSGAATAGLQEKFKGDVVKRMPYLGNTENSYTRAALKVGVEEVGTRASNMVTKPFDQIVQDKVKSDAAGNHYGGSDAQKSWSGSVQKTATDFSWKDGASLAKNTHDEATKNPPATSHRAEGYPTTGYKDAETSNTPRHQKK
ncbi:DUF6531 domain-containing protein [Rothia sp. HMSC065D02]|uniref:DUF6531 domain-containing protein n=1 Tax=Rothia sp. HMSC065D02 TaxID=1739518 RepID=UPI000A6FB14F|nr:DUF6531 domain-containing protein [Rothia sp. HMSC065D02]